MSTREERLARNEAASRDINEKIEEAYQDEPPANRIDIMCECARTTCDAAIDITLSEYEEVKGDARHFVILPGHFVGDIEWIVAENDRFAVDQSSATVRALGRGVPRLRGVGPSGRVLVGRLREAERSGPYV